MSINIRRLSIRSFSCGIIAVIAYMSIVFPVQADSSIKTEHTFSENDSSWDYLKMRMTFNTGNFLFRTDVNSLSIHHRPNQWMFSYKIKKTDRTEWSLIQSGDTHYESGETIFDAGFHVKQKIDTSLTGAARLEAFFLYTDDDFKGKKASIALFGRYMNVKYQKNSYDGIKNTSVYYINAHNDHFGISIGKRADEMTGLAFMFRSAPFSTFAYGYFDNTDNFSITFKNSLSEHNMRMYNHQVQEIGSEMMIIRTKGVFYPRFSLYQTYGKLTHFLEFKRSQGNLMLNNEVGYAFKVKTLTIGVGGGLTLFNDMASKAEIKPSLSFYLKFPAGKSAVFMESTYKDDNFGVYFYTMKKF